MSLVESMGARCVLALALLVGLAGAVGGASSVPPAEQPAAATPTVLAAADESTVPAGKESVEAGAAVRHDPERLDAPPAAVRVPLPIERAGPRRDPSRSALAHDGDPTTGWTVGTAPVSVWFDLGASRPLAAVRWLPVSDAPVEVQRSRDGKRWATVGRVSDPEAGAWHVLPVDRPARYVRFVFGDPETGDAVAVGQLAEVEIDGQPDADDRPVTREQRPDRERAADGQDGDRDRARDRRPARPAAAETATDPGEADGTVTIGDRTVEGEARVVEECGDGTGECRIEVDVSGGTAVCDESGGTGNVVRGRGRASAGDGGTCSRDASGGTVEIGDINP